MTLRLSTLVALAVAVVAAACGDNGGLSRDEFIQQANEICQEHRSNIEAAASEILAGGQMPSPEEFRRLAQETIIPETRQQLEEIGEFEPPDEFADEVDAYVTGGEEFLNRMEEDPSIIQDPGNAADVNQAADEIGLSPACRIGPG
ncbi:MAG: hypothetical protein M3N57_02530 [Actinomycetota bacterium]|nr:hypothetical protein [Actinomycetota bacterium]